MGGLRDGVSVRSRTSHQSASASSLVRRSWPEIRRGSRVSRTVVRVWACTLAFMRSSIGVIAYVYSAAICSEEMATGRGGSGCPNTEVTSISGALRVWHRRRVVHGVGRSAIATYRPTDAVCNSCSPTRSTTVKATSCSPSQFHGQEGLAATLARCARFHDLHRKEDSIRNRRVTHWWRRGWKGAISRPCLADDTFEDPLFGVAEWVAFSPQPDSHTSAGAAQHGLMLRFEEDLQLTWDSWSRVLSHVRRSSHKGLHPSLVPPRGCWLAEPAFEPQAPALRFV